jgi:uncharacterized phiE125 gp8 family phage protein
MQLKLTTAAAVQPVTIDEAKLHLRVEHDADNTLITALIATAVEQLDGRYGRLRRAILTQTWDMFECGFPICRKWELPMPPLQQVVSVKYYDASNVQQTFGAENYDVITNAFVGYIKLKPGMSWPPTYQRDDAVDIQFKCGFGDDGSACPAPIKAAILLTVGYLYANRGDAGENPAFASQTRGAAEDAIDRLIGPYRLVTV